MQEKDLALSKHQPYLVRWVREFLLSAQEHDGYTFEQTLELFLAEAGGCLYHFPRLSEIMRERLLRG